MEQEDKTGKLKDKEKKDTINQKCTLYFVTNNKKVIYSARDCIPHSHSLKSHYLGSVQPFIKKKKVQIIGLSILLTFKLSLNVSSFLKHFKEETQKQTICGFAIRKARVITCEKWEKDEDRNQPTSLNEL